MIYLLRHGETAWNTLGRFQGQKDSPLTQLGIKQADSVARLLHREILDAAHSCEMHISPLDRALETADRIRRVLPLPSRQDTRLMEVSVGSWDGLTKFEIANEFPGALDGADAFDWYFRVARRREFRRGLQQSQKLARRRSGANNRRLARVIWPADTRRLRRPLQTGDAGAARTARRVLQAFEGRVPADQLHRTRRLQRSPPVRGGNGNGSGHSGGMITPVY